MLDLGKSFDVDEELETKGVWHDLGDGAALLIAAENNKNFLDLYRKIPPGIRLQLDRGTLPDKVSKKITAELVSKTILLGWKGLSDEGKEIKYTQEKACEQLLKHRKFFTFVWELSRNEGAYLVAEQQAIEKNS